MKTHLIAYTKNELKKCTSVAYVCNVNEDELDRLQSECQEHEKEIAKEKHDLLFVITKLENKIKALEEEIKVLKGEDDETKEIIEVVESIEQGENENE